MDLAKKWIYCMWIKNLSTNNKINKNLQSLFTPNFSFLIKLCLLWVWISSFYTWEHVEIYNSLLSLHSFLFVILYIIISNGGLKTCWTFFIKILFMYENLHSSYSFSTFTFVLILALLHWELKSLKNIGVH